MKPSLLRVRSEMKPSSRAFCSSASSVAIFLCALTSAARKPSMMLLSQHAASYASSSISSPQCRDRLSCSCAAAHHAVAATSAAAIAVVIVMVFSLGGGHLAVQGGHDSAARCSCCTACLLSSCSVASGCISVTRVLERRARAAIRTLVC